MSRIPLILLALTFVITAADEALQELAAGNLKFTAKSYKKLIETEKGNVLICGISAEIVLSLLTHGAKGATKTELQQALGEGDDSINAYRQLIPILNQKNEDLTLLSANRLYAAYGFQIEECFKQVSQSPYRADIQNLNFAENTKSAGVINNWVANNTNNKITNLITPDQLNANTRLVLVNTLYLFGKWFKPFKTYLTAKKPFYTTATQSKDIDMMHDEGSYRYRHCGYSKAQFLEIPFRQPNITMTFILSDARDGLAALEQNIEQLLEPHDMKYERVALSLPKFNIRSTINYIPILKSLGVQKVFSPQQSDLTGISRKGGLSVDFITQQTYINVTETGVEAAAATAVGVGFSLTAVQQQPKAIIFNADHPLIFYIKDENSGIVFFVGRFNN